MGWGGEGTMRLRPSWGRGVRGRARQPTRVRGSVPISPSNIGAILLRSRGCWRRLRSDPLGVAIELSPPTTAKEATMEVGARAKWKFERGVRRHRSKDGT